jgi:hypothetical protein
MRRGIEEKIINSEVYAALWRARDKFNAELGVNILNALRQAPGTLSQIYDRTNGKYTRKQLTEVLALLFSVSRLVGQESKMGWGNSEEVPYFLKGPEPTPEPEAIPPQVYPVEDSSGN